MKNLRAILKMKKVLASMVVCLLAAVGVTVDPTLVDGTLTILDAAISVE